MIRFVLGMDILLLRILMVMCQWKAYMPPLEDITLIVNSLQGL